MSHSHHRIALVAIVEDNTLILEVLEGLLGDEGYTTHAYCTGIAAQQGLISEPPDLVILDLHLEQPNSGLLVLDVLRLHPQTSHVPVIVCSVDGSFLQAKAMHLQAHDCAILEKPFLIDELLAVIKRTLANR